MPESWVENAVNIPKTAKKQKKMILKPYLIGTAASLVFAVVLSLILIFGANQHMTIPISYQSTQNNTQPTSLSADASDTVAYDESPSTTVLAEEKSTENETLPKSFEKNQFTEPPNNTDSHEKTTTRATVSVEPTEKPQIQTEEPTKSIDTPMSPTDEPWIPIEPPVEVTSPVETAPIDEPTTTQSLSGELFTGNIIFFPNEQLQQSGELFCHIIYGGKPMGKAFSQAESMTIDKTDGFLAICNPLNNGIEMHCGQTCEIRFYDRRLRAYYFYDVVLGTNDVVLYAQ